MSENSQSTNYFEWDNLPNRLTIFRVLLIPVVVFCLGVSRTEFLAGKHQLLGWIAGWTFVAASITDFLDGYIARKKDIVTVFGSFLDPIADKFLVVSSLVMLLSVDRLPTIVVIVLILREIYMTSLRLLAQVEGISVPVSGLGKWKTALQMIGIPMLMANAPLFGIPLQILGPIFLYAATLFSIISALKYTNSSYQKLKTAKAKLQGKISE